MGQLIDGTDEDGRNRPEKVSLKAERTQYRRHRMHIRGGGRIGEAHIDRMLTVQRDEGDTLGR